MSFVQDLANLIINSGKDYFVVGIIGLPYAGKSNLASSLVDELSILNTKAEHFDVDIYYIEMAPGINMRRGNLSRDMQEFKEGIRIFIGDRQVGQDTKVLIFTATLKFLPKEPSAYSAFDYIVFSTFEDGRVRLDRKLKAEGHGGQGKVADEIIGEFTQEQFQEHDAMDIVRQADVIWCDDTKKLKRLAT